MIRIPERLEDLKTIIPTKCFGCKVPLSYIVTPMGEPEFRNLVATKGLYQFCEKCLNKVFRLNAREFEK